MINVIINGVADFITESKKYEARTDKALAALAAEKNEPKLF